jgi:chromosome segregation ATPase
MTEQQLQEIVMTHSRELAAMQESLKNAHSRLDENDRVTDGIHELATNIKMLAMQVKMMTEQFDCNLARLEAGQKNQGERLGRTERVIELTEVMAERLESGLRDAAKRLETMEKEPGTKWKTLTAQLISLAVAALMGAIFAHVF